MCWRRAALKADAGFFASPAGSEAVAIHTFCVEQLRRLPCEVDVPLADLMTSMLAYSVLLEKREQEIENIQHGYRH